MSKFKLETYQRHKVQKLDAIPRSISIERRHHIFVERLNINLSQLVRDLLDDLIKEADKANESKTKKT